MKNGKNSPSRTVEGVSKTRIVPDVAYRQASLLQSKGYLSEAASMCNMILQEDPAHDDALHLLGILAAQTGDFVNAEVLISRAILLNPKNAAFHTNLGNVLAALKRPDIAVQSFNRAIAIKPDFAEAYFNLGTAQREIGNFDAAVASFDRAIALKSSYADAFCGRGFAQQELGLFEAAISSFNTAIALNPEYVEAYSYRGIAQFSVKQIDAALESFDKAQALAPGSVDVLVNRGIGLVNAGFFVDAHQCLQQAAGINPNRPDIHNNLGTACMGMGSVDAAIESFKQSLNLDSRQARALTNLGIALMSRSDFDQAVDCFSKAAEVDPGYVDAYFNRGNALLKAGQSDAALQDYDRVLSMNPRHVKAIYNRGNLLKQMDRLEASIESYDRAIAISPDQVDAYNNRGTVLTALGRLDAAVEDFNAAIRLDPGFPDAYYNCALTLLKGGDYQKGWDLYEWRWKGGNKSLTAINRAASFGADWDGTDSDGHLVVLAEQGVGDEIFYCGMLGDLKSRVQRITVELDRRLIPLFRRSFPELNFVPRGELRAESKFDSQINLASLGRFFRSSKEALNRVSTPYLHADLSRAAGLRARLASPDKLICGISWISKSSAIGGNKSVKLKDLRPLLELPHADFIDLQYGDTSAERQEMLDSAGLRIRKVEEIDNFSDLDGLAALIAACDIVISVSNTTAHLALALGKPVFVMVPSATETLWYWHIESETSPWYPTARLFRQEKGGHWDGVIARVGQALQSHAAVSCD